MRNPGVATFANRLVRFARAKLNGSILKSPTTGPPLTLHIEATNRCNLSCAMCFQQTMERPKGRIALPLYKSIIEQATGWVHHLQIANFGEPLLHPELEQMIRFAADRNFFVELFTNGVLLDKPTAQMLVRAGTSKVNISIDALDPATYFDLRGTDLAPVLDNVRHLAKAKEETQSITPYIVIAAADLRSNKGQPEKIQQQFCALGANGWYVTPSMNWAGSAKDSASVKPTGKAYSGCLFPWVLVNVSQTGIVTPCCIDAELSNAVGDVNKEGLRQSWNGESMQRLRRALLNGDLDTLAKISNCAKCSRLYRSQNAYAFNRARIEWAQLRYFLGQR